MEQITNKIVEWLREQVEGAKARGLVVGVSGGIDSAVVANLIKRAFPDDSLGVIMPLKSSEQDIVDANHVVAACNLKTITVDLTKSHETLFQETKKQIEQFGEWDDSRVQIADANLRARLRMSTLYTVATNYNYLVVGTDNLAEWYTGYFTKYGDGGVDLQPIIDLKKREVYELARHLNVPLSVIEKKPSADLWEGQTDELEMGTTYEHIDDYIDGKEIPEKDRLIIERLHKQTEHKRNIATQLRLK